MIVETKFNLGDFMYSIWRGSLSVEKKCGFCGGTGKIAGLSGDIRPCPECYGEPVYDYVPDIWQVGDVFKVARISIDRHSGKDQKEDRIYYMHGRSGTMHMEETLFPSKAEAQEECDRRNAIKETSA